MIIAVLIIFTLCVFYLARYMLQKRMKAAAAVLIGLCACVILLSGSVLWLEQAHPEYPDSETIYTYLADEELFYDMSRQETFLPDYTLYVLFSLSVIDKVTVAACALVMLHVLLRLTRRVIEAVSSLRVREIKIRTTGELRIPSRYIFLPILRMNCRMNC